MRLPIVYITLALLVSVMSACSSHEEYIVKRRQRLLEIYPLHTTTRSEIAQKWSPTKPEFSYTRPEAGWLTLKESYIGQLADAAEKKNGKSVARVERYLGVDGFFSLARCWFYYGEEDSLIDVAWQYVSD